ncbi:bacterial proteasome activator family protein [uncultured Jatrophihabitans sp.]|uniref:bacterial proteasome activator family protein n=1 Tax=uncultured Jatrophihabitans sp. TaxID=1610747 RepID=UPI0035C9CC4D
MSEPSDSIAHPQGAGTQASGTQAAGAADPAGVVDVTEDDAISAQVQQPAKVMRIGTMIKQLLEEVRAAPLDEAGRARLREIHESSIRELETGLAPELREELDRITIPFGGETPSEAELRIAQAQLVGWLEGLFHGIQTALFAQQMVARQQLEEIRRRALPGGGDGGQHVIVGPGGQMIMPPGVRLTPASGDDEEHGGRGTGQYL